MWDDVVIGHGVKGNTAITVFSIPGKHHISQNSVSYWISDVYLGLGMTIFKDTEEGKQLKQLIDSKVELEIINNFVIDLLLKNIETLKLRKAIDKELNQAFLRGKDAKVSEIRDVLKFHHY